MNNLINAKLIYDYSEKGVTVPKEMLPAGKTQDEALDIIKAKGQMVGTNAEMLSETSSRICYDSLGNGRDSQGLHVHLKEVNHGSVYEHFNFTAALDCHSDQDLTNILLSLANRPGVWMRPDLGKDKVRVTLNLRSILEWDRVKLDTPDGSTKNAIGIALRVLGNAIAPMVIPAVAHHEIDTYGQWRAVRAEPETDEEKWVSMFISGSRGLSHELVRHGDRSAISQRSTRYVDESAGAWVTHPLVSQYFESGADVVDEGECTLKTLKDRIEITQELARDTYDRMVNKLQPWLISKGVDKFTARKQARGAARGYLGNALQTELVFSASVAQWKRILGQRLNAAADAEIREMGAKALIALNGSQYAKDFYGCVIAPSPDGIGVVLA